MDAIFQLWQLIAALRDLVKAFFAIWYSFCAESEGLG